ncbi:MAG TPA: hypothetical protein VFG68_17890 [Fimbriiglobus sp.]|nr:hypothetical protein [Fimbriiglobus sp.]
MPRIETPPNTRRRRWRVLIALGLLALLAGAIIAGWWNSRTSLSDEERHLVGTWTYQWDGHPEKLPLDYEFRSDHTCRIRNFDPKTGAVLVETTGVTWRLSGDRLTVRHPGAAGGEFWHLFPSQRDAVEVIILTPDGPDRFHYRSTIEIRSTPTQPPVTGTMTRVIPAE